jgi:hypothetical protein
MECISRTPTLLPQVARGCRPLQAVREREHAQADAAREQAGLAHEQAEQIRLDRRHQATGSQPLCSRKGRALTGFDGFLQLTATIVILG